MLEWDILNPHYLIWVSNGHTYDFLPKPFFLEYIVEKNQKQVLKNQKVPPVSVYNVLNGAQNIKFIGFIYATLIGWILYIFPVTSTRLG